MHQVIALDPKTETELRETIEDIIRAGYNDDDEIASVAADLANFHGDMGIVEKIKHETLTRLRMEQNTWPIITDYDRLAGAFADLEAEHILARENYTCCNSCGSEEIQEEVNRYVENGRPIIGFTFFHMQDTENALEGSGLYLSYSSVREDEISSLEIGSRVASALTRRGLKIEWNGDVRVRIHVNIDWKRRRL